MYRHYLRDARENFLLASRGSRKVNVVDGLINI
jgi:hypothetical protein